MAKRRLTGKQASEMVEAAITTLRSVAPDLVELERRRQFEVADGYPAGSLGGGGSTSDVSDPTAKSAMARPEDDPTGTAIDTVFKAMPELDELCRVIGNAHRLVIDTGESQRGRQSTIKSCMACGSAVTGNGNDRLRRGFCRSCFGKWERYAAGTSDPSTVVFCRSIQHGMTTRPDRERRSVHTNGRRAIPID